MMTQLKNKATAQLADDLIGAAQRLEQQAKSLKDTAKIIRREGLLILDGMDAIQNQREHKAANIKSAATSALHTLGTLNADQWLQERQY